MKGCMLLLLAHLMGAHLCCAQVFPKDTLRHSGAGGNRIRFVFLGDGYTPAEMPQYINHVTTASFGLFNTSPFKEYASYFNVYAVRVPSAEAGAKHPRSTAECPPETSHSVSNPLNYFGSRFDAFGIHRLVVPDSMAKIQLVLAANYPTYNQAFVMVNSPHYGGAGGSVAVATRETNSVEVAVHEIGHSFAGLADEYWAGPQYAAELPNMTQQTSPTLVKWAAWVGTNNVGLFPYNGGAGWYRPVPSNNCKMEVLGKPFCPVCTETIVEKIHNLVTPLEGFSPATAVVNMPGGNMGFKLNLLRPSPNTLKVVWRLNGTIIGTNTDSVTVNGANLGGGNNNLQAVITDTTALTRSGQHITNHSYSVQWNLGITTGISRPQLSAFHFTAFPNPFSETLHISYELQKPAVVALQLINSLGITVEEQRYGRQAAGKHRFSFNLKNKPLPDGNYYLIMTIDGVRMAEELVRIKK